MILTLSAVSLNDQALSRPITASFDAGGGTIGRADHSTMALPDPERYISRKQAEIVCVGDGFTIRNVGAANPITVAQRTLAAGETAPLRDGDEVRIGGYLLRAECRAGPAGHAIAGLAAGRTGAVADTMSPTVVSGAMPAGRAAAAAPAAAGAAFAASPPLASDNPFADLLGPAAATPDVTSFGAGRGAGAARAAPAPGDDPFADLVLPPPAGLTASLGGVAAAPPAAAAAQLPDDFDPFGAPPAPAGPAAGLAGRFPDPSSDRVSAPSSDPFADLLGNGAGGNAPSIDQAFGLGSSAAADDALARFIGAPAGPSPSAGAAHGGVPTDPLLLFGDDAAAPPAAASPRAGTHAKGPPAAGEPGPAAPKGPVALPDHLPAVHGAFVPPRVAPVRPSAPSKPSAPPSPAVPPPPVARAAGAAPAAPVPPAAARAVGTAPATPRGPAAAAASPAAAADTAALWRAFCEGAGIDLPVPGGEGEALMRHVGRILRSAVEGTLQLAAVRASTKHEMRAQVTQIRSTANNPLKFSPDATAGLAQLLSPPQRGFLDGAAAMDDVMLDLVGHSIGTVAGMRAALEGLLERFDPAALEETLGAGSLLSSVLPAHRKARLWELYLQHHRRIRDEAEEDFHTVFGRAFVAAYEEQVERLAQQQRQRPRGRR